MQNYSVGQNIIYPKDCEAARIFEIRNSNVWQENQIGQRNTAFRLTIRLQPWIIDKHTVEPL